MICSYHLLIADVAGLKKKEKKKVMEMVWQKVYIKELTF